MLLPGEIDVQHLQTIRDGLFFIVGPHRSGTTLLQAMLSSHSGLTIPPETGYFDQVWPRRATLGTLADAANLERVGRFVNGPDCAVSDLQLDWSRVTAALALTSRGYDDLFVACLAVYARSRKKRRVGEKSPRHLFAVPDLSQLYPQSKFLCLIRDPRAVVLSERETSWGSRSVTRIVRRWCRVLATAEQLERTLSPDRFRVIRYEDLVADPETQLRAICEFLGEPFEPQMLEFPERATEERGFRPDEVWKQNTLQPVDSSRAERWRSGLTPAEIRLIERLAGSPMLQRGYRPLNQPAGVAAVAWTWVADHVQWAGEVAAGILRGRSRRRPWSSVWRDVWGT